MDEKMRFIPGLALNRAFFHEVVGPLLQKHFPGLNYSAALMGYGSDVLGFDTEISMDHNWGPRLQLFVDDKKVRAKINACLRSELPLEFKGFPANFTDQRYDKTQSMRFVPEKPVNHLIEIGTFGSYLKKRYGINKTGHFEPKDWLGFTDQGLLEITSGEVYCDGLEVVNSLRQELEFYPPDILKLRLAVLWWYISNKEAFVGRTIALNDKIGVKIITGRIVNYLIKILFYLEKKYIPYSKWFGAGFKKLTVYSRVSGLIGDLLDENNISGIEEKLCSLYETVVAEHNRVRDLPPINNGIRNYFGRPYKVIFAEDIFKELKNSIEDGRIKNTDIRKYGHDIIIDA